MKEPIALGASAVMTLPESTRKPRRRRARVGA
jgi:hypothetical protein